MPIVFEQIVVTHFGISDQFSYPVQEFMLKNDTLKNGTSRIGLYGSAPPGLYSSERNQESQLLQM